MNKPTHHALIVFVARGLADDVMDIARDSGATGGTIIHARGCGHHDSHSFLSVPLDTERDIVLIVLPVELTSSIAHAIAEQMQLNKPGNGFLFTLDIDQATGITKPYKQD